MRHWTFPNVQTFMQKRTIVSVRDVILNDTSIGYILETTTGLSTDETLCLYEYKPSWLKVRAFNKLVNEYANINRSCIVSTSIKSWGPSKVKKTKTSMDAWIKDYFDENIGEERHKEFINAYQEVDTREDTDIDKSELINEIKQLHRVLGEKISLLESLIDM